MPAVGDECLEFPEAPEGKPLRVSQDSGKGFGLGPSVDEEGLSLDPVRGLRRGLSGERDKGGERDQYIYVFCAASFSAHA